MLIKLIIISILLFILSSLASALFFLVRDKGRSNRLAQALTFRIGLSLALFILLILAFVLGYINPHGIGEIPKPLYASTTHS